MILQALAKYYDRLAEEGGVAPQGYKKVEIPFLIILDRNGYFRSLQDTRTGSGKKPVARSFLVPEEKGRSGSKAWQISNLLWDHYGYVLAWPKSDSSEHREMARKQHSSFVSEIRKLHQKHPEDTEIAAVHSFLSKGDFKCVFEDESWKDCSKIPGCNLTFVIEGEGRLRLVCENESVRTYISEGSVRVSEEDEDGSLPEVEAICLVTGEVGPVARLHPRTPIRGAKSNSKIVSFQKGMGFDSYGKLQSHNAPTSKRAAFAYTTALNELLSKNSSQKLFIGEDSVIFWAEKRHEFEKVFASMFGDPARGEPEQDYKSIISLFRAPLTGVHPEMDPDTFFYVLGLSPNAARIAVRFWYYGMIREVAENVWQHFNDLEVIKGAKEWRTINLRNLLRSTAILEKEDNVPHNLPGEIMKAALSGKPYPQTLLSAAVRRCRAEREVTYPRAALIKAVLVRDSRFGFRFFNKDEKEVSMSLDLGNTNRGYRLGRLFSVLEKVQEEANPGINATIRERFYGSASATPVAAFPHLMKLKNHHLAKIENTGRVVNLERLIGEIIDGIDDFPAQLSLADQGRFAVGYYHQRQDFFTKKTKDQKEDKHE